MFLAEFFGTMTLIVLGDGVVANVLLNKSKGQNSGWIVITAGWAIAVMSGVFVSAALGGGGSLNPAGEVAGMIAGGDVMVGLTNIAAQVAGAFVGAEPAGAWQLPLAALLLLAWTAAGLLLAPRTLRRMTGKESGSRLSDRQQRALQRTI